MTRKRVWLDTEADDRGRHHVKAQIKLDDNSKAVYHFFYPNPERYRAFRQLQKRYPGLARRTIDVIRSQLG